MIATNMCSDFGGFRCSPPLILFFNLPTHPRYPVQTFISKPHTLPTTLFPHPLLIFPPPSSPVDSLPSLTIYYQTTLSSLPSSPPASSTLDILHCHSCFCIAFPQKSLTHSYLCRLQLPVCTTPSWPSHFCCMLHTLSPNKLLHRPSSVNFHLFTHSGHPHHLSNPLFCLIHHLLYVDNTS